MDTLAKESVAAPPGGVQWSSWFKAYALLMLLGAQVFASVDRQLVAILLQPIKDDLGASDTQMGLLTGLYFSFFHAVLAVPLARLADYSSRRNIIAVCVAGWSVATMLCGLAQNYTQMAVARMLVAVGEAGNGPAGQSIMAQVYSAKVRARVFGVISGGSAIGMAFGIFLGGTLNDALGWRNVFLVVGAPGVVFALLFFLTVKEPYRPPAAAKAAATGDSIFNTLKAFWKMPTYRLLLFINIMGGSGGFALLGWSPTFFNRVHHLSHHEIGMYLGLSTMIGLFLGNVTGGYLADRLARRDPKWLVYVPAIGLILMAPLTLLVVFNPSVTGALVAYAVLSYFNAYFPPCIGAAAMGISDLRSRALAAAMVGLCITVGGAIGPFFVGLLNDMLNAEHGAQAIRLSLAAAIIFPLAGGLAGLIFGHHLSKDYKHAESVRQH